MKRLLFLPLSFALGGCSLGLMQKDYVSRAETIPVTAAPASVGTLPVTRISVEDQASQEARRIATLLLPESAGRIVKVREKHFSNGTRQEIILAAGPGVYGENVVDVSIRTAAAGPRDSNPMTIGPPSENGMRSEILARFPDVQMNIVTRPMRNGLGPFGLAIGKHPNGARCIFAWQWANDLREFSPGQSNVAKFNALMANKTLQASVRIRLCSTGSTVDQLAGAIEALQVGSNSAIERIATLDRREIDGETVTASGVRATPLIKPVGVSLEAALARPARQAAPAATERRLARPTARKLAVRNAARRIAPTQSAPAYAPPVQPAFVQPGTPAPQVFGRRYLAPVAGLPQNYGAAMPGSTMPGAAASGAGAANLPPQAYRGPIAPAQ